MLRSGEPCWETGADLERPRLLRSTPRLRSIAQAQLSAESCRSRPPAGVLYAASLWLSNGSYLHLSVSFIQMTKSLMPGLVYMSGCLIGTERPHVSVAAVMLLIAAGVVVCALGEADLSLRGLAMQLTALLFEATRLTLVQVRPRRPCVTALTGVHTRLPAFACALMRRMPWQLLAFRGRASYQPPTVIPAVVPIC